MTLPRQPFAETQLPFKAARDHGGATIAVAATCTLTADTNANTGNTDTVTLNDGERSVVYEYDKGADGVVAGRVAVTAGTTAATVAANFRTAILANQPRLGVVDGGAGVLTLTNLIAGADGNTTNAKSSSSALAVTNFAGGVDASTGLTVTTTLPLETLDFTTRIDSCEVLNGTGFTADAANYWTITLQAGATVMATWSTMTGAEGTLTANVAGAMTLHATDANRVGAAGALLKLVFTKTGSPANFPSGRIIAHGRIVA